MWMTMTTLGAWFGAAFLVDRYGRRAEPGMDPFDAIVVPGCRVLPSGKPSLSLERRVRLAVALYHAGLAPRLVLTGGVGQHPPSEARAAADLAETLGVSCSAMVLEERSVSTETNASLAATLIGPDARVLVATDAYHVYRAERVFRRYFRDAKGVGAVGANRGRIRGALREVAAIVGYAARGRL